MYIQNMSGKTVAPGESHGKAADARRGDVYLIGGDDEYMVTAKTREVIEKLVPAEQQVLGLEIIDGRTDNSDESMRCLRQCLEGLQTLGFLGGSKVIWLRDADFLAPGPKGRSKDMQLLIDALVEVVGQGMPPGQKLVITMAKLDARSALYKACARCGEVLEFSLSEKAWEACRQAVDVAVHAFKRAGIGIGREAAQALVERVGYDTRGVTNEVQKLLLYIGKRREVVIGDVLAVVPAVRETAAWDLADAVGERDLSKGLRVLRQLMFQKEAPIGLAAGLEKRVALLIVLRTALDRGWMHLQKKGSWGAQLAWATLPPAADKVLDSLGKDDPRSLHPFRAGKLAEQAERFSLQELLKARELAARAREQMVTTGIPPFLVLELLLAAVLGRRAR